MTTSSHNLGRAVRLGCAAALGVLALTLGTLPGQTQAFPDRGGNERDQVTNLLCFTPSCDVVRHPTANCICAKENPAEMELSKLRLRCEAKEGGQWVACPVPLPFGR